MHQKLNERVVDLDPQETAEWVEALDQVIDDAGPDRAAYLLQRLTDRAQANGAELPIQTNTPYVNTIRPEDEVPVSGRPRHGAPHQEPDSLERDGDGGAAE